MCDRSLGEFQQNQVSQTEKIVRQMLEFFGQKKTGIDATCRGLVLFAPNEIDQILFTLNRINKCYTPDLGRFFLSYIFDKPS